MIRCHFSGKGIAARAKHVTFEGGAEVLGPVGGNRRAMLGAAVLATLGAILGARAASAALPRLPAGRDLAEMAAACVATDRLLAELGARYLVRGDTESSVSLLLARIGERWPAGQAGLAELPFESLRRALATIVQRDLERADVALVDGWVLARSEARLYAIAHLVRRRGAV